MNKHLHRIVFNAARGMRMVVQNYDLTNRNIMVVDQFGKVLIPLQPMSNFRKVP